MDSLTDGNSGHHRVILEGDLTIRGIEAAHAVISEAATEHGAIEIDCAAATAIDISFVQLLLAARKSASLSGKTVALAHPAAGMLFDTLSRGGFLDETVETSSADRGFWLGTKEST